ncbi:MAG: pilus assembly protein [Clostridia bacterium]|nr:pilus assembly protein [Clostridia bacterium]
MKKRRTRRRFRGEDGQAMLELALILPIFLLILCGILDFGWMYYNQLALNNICREGARYAVVNTAENKETDGILRHIENFIDDTYPIDDVVVTVAYTKPLDPLSGDVVVAAEKEFHYLTPVISTVTGQQSRMLTAKVVMKVES